MMEKVRVWDIPTRLFHWLLVVLFGCSWWSAENGQMEWHQLSGTSLLGLVVFRILWGLIGGSTARFATFVKSPRKVVAYLRLHSHTAQAGHSPIGGYSVLVMLSLLSAQIVAGLLAVDVDGIESGPLSHLVSFDAGRIAAEVHETAFNVMLAVIAVHVAAVLFYTLARRQKLIKRMFTGNDPDLPSTVDGLRLASKLRFVGALAIAVACAWWVRNGLEF